MNDFNPTVDFRIRCLALVLVVGGFVGLANIWIHRDSFPQSAILGICTLLLWTTLIYLLRTRQVVRSAVASIVTTFITVQTFLVLYGDPKFVSLGFAIPIAAALFLNARLAGATLTAYCLLSLFIAIAIWSEFWVPPYWDSSIEPILILKQTLTATTIIFTITVALIWNEQLFSNPSEREQDQQKRYETICDNGYDAIIESDSNGVVTFASGRLISDFGFQSNDVVGRHQLEFIDLRDRSKFIRSVKHEGQRFQYDTEVRVTDKTNKPRWVRISGGSFISAKNHIHWVHGMREIEDQVRSREQFYDMARLESLGVVCSGLAHDFNNLLTVIGIYAEQIAESNIRHNIAQALEQTQDLTSGLLTFARKQDFREKKISLTDFLIASKPLIERLAKSRIKCSWGLKAHQAMVCVDPAQLQQLLINLVNNSVHAMPQGGTLRFESAVVDVLPDHLIGDNPVETYAALHIIDSGVGMDREVMKRAIEPFYTTKPRGKGTGLGLAMAHGIVRQANGVMDITSEPGLGTTVSIYLPTFFNGKNISTSQNQRSADGTPEALNILLVEDRELVGKAIANTLKFSGAYVMLVPNAEQASVLLKDDVPFDLIVSDLILPGINGAQLIEKAITNNANIKAILISGHQQQDLRLIHNNPGRVKFLAKPFASIQLQEMIDELTARSDAKI